MKKPQDMTLEELKTTIEEWPPFRRPAYRWLSASEQYYRLLRKYIDELMRRRDDGH